MSRVVSVAHAFPPNYYRQEELLEALLLRWGDHFFNKERLRRLHENVLVGGRYLALPLADYDGLETWGQANDAWIEVAQKLGTSAVQQALDDAGLSPDEVDTLYSTTVTGVATPSLDARLMNSLGLRPDVKRVPMFGLGCLAGAAGVARAADYTRGFPDEVAVLLSVELCSLTIQQQDLSIPNLIATGLFGDGAAAAVVVGDKRGSLGPKVVASRSIFYPDSERVMGWDISERGFSIVLSAEVPSMVSQHLAGDVDAFLSDHGLERGDISRWIAHPGGPKVLQAMAESLSLPEEALSRTWRSLREVGNLSSTSILLVLEEVMSDPPPVGSWGLMTAMGPGFCSELVLLEFS